MLFRLSHAFVAASLLASAFATPKAAAVARNDPSCTTGPVQCCDTTETVTQALSLLTLLGITVPVAAQDLLVGLSCTALGVGGSCTAQQVCCTDNNFNGLVNIGCSPVSVL